MVVGVCHSGQFLHLCCPYTDYIQLKMWDLHEKVMSRVFEINHTIESAPDSKLYDFRDCALGNIFSYHTTHYDRNHCHLLNMLVF